MLELSGRPEAGGLSGGKPFADLELSPTLITAHVDEWLRHFRETRTHLMQAVAHPDATGEAAEAFRNYHLLRPILHAIRSAKLESIAASQDTLRARITVTARDDSGSPTAD